VITLKILRTGTDIKDEKKLNSLIEDTQIDVKGEQESSRIFLDGTEVTAEIRSAEVNGYVSQVSAVPMVREAMVALQQEIARQYGAVVMDGRDIGTCVLPHADLKIYLDASPEERVKRRWEECRAKGQHSSKEEIAKEIGMRDNIDSSRDVSPLEVAPGAIVVDTTNMGIQQVVEVIAGYAGEVKCSD